MIRILGQFLVEFFGVELFLQIVGRLSEAVGMTVFLVAIRVLA